MEKYRPFIQKKHIARETGIPTEFPWKCYQPAVSDIPSGSPEILIGMDSGVCNTSFACLELIRDEETNAVIDFKFMDAYYFRDELEQFAYKIDRQIYLTQQYYNLFSHQNVKSLTYELLPLTSIKKEDTLKGIIETQATTDIISLIAYQLGHFYIPVPAKAIKHCLTGKGDASKYDMCMTAYSWTKDEDLLYNDHKADAFAMCFYSFVQELKKSCMYYDIPIPEKFTYMDWNYKDMPSYLH